MHLGIKFLLKHKFLTPQIFKYCNSCSSVAHACKAALCDEAIEYLNPRPHKVFIDMTFGAGSHTLKLFEKCEDIKIFALDRNPIAYKCAVNLSAKYPGRLIPLRGKFSDLPQLLDKNNIKYNSVDGILFDFGGSAMQFDGDSSNGFLDMRLDCDNNTTNGQITAADVLARIDEADLVKLLRVYGEEKAAKKIARIIIGARSALHRIETTKQLADLVDTCLKGTSNHSENTTTYTHAAAKTFQALRIFVNNELNEINYGITLANKYLRPNGRLVTISHHPLEDAIVKRHFNGNIETMASPLPLKYRSHHVVHSKYFLKTLLQPKWNQIHKNVIAPNEEELMRHNRSRSVKLRAAIKTA